MEQKPRKKVKKKKNKDGKKSESMIISPLQEIASQGFQVSFFFYSRDFNYDLIILPPTQRVRERENPQASSFTNQTPREPFSLSLSLCLYCFNSIFTIFFAKSTVLLFSILSFLQPLPQLSNFHFAQWETYQTRAKNYTTPLSTLQYSWSSLSQIHHFFFSLSYYFSTISEHGLFFFCYFALLFSIQFHCSEQYH